MHDNNYRHGYGLTSSDMISDVHGKPKQGIGSYLLILVQKILVLTAFVFFVSYVQTVTAQESPEIERVSQGTLFYRNIHDRQYRSTPMLSTDVEMRISGFINRAHITQTFINGSNDWVEGVYVFPLPENAAVDNLRIRIGERVIEGKIKERTEAKKIYENAKSQGKRTSLLDQERPNMFTTSIANIGPNEQVKIEIEFQQTLRYDQGQFHLRFPLAITPRYIPGEQKFSESLHINNSSLKTGQVKDADRITPVFSQGKKGNSFSMHIELDAGFDLEELSSTYHAIHRKQHGKGQYTISLANGRIIPDRDFELIWKPELGDAPRAALFREQVGDNNYYLVMMLPPEQSIDQKQVLSREVVYVIDTSGSMGGVSIRQARKALLLALKRLGPGDYFNVIQFNSTTHKLFAEAQPATILNIARARSYVANMSANGGTEMLAAMREALIKQGDNQRLRQVIFLTDGAIGNEDALFEYVRHHLGQSRLFTVGIGSAPNSHFMSKAAQFGRGTFTYIGDVNEVQVKMQALFIKLDTPIIRDLTISHNLEDLEIWPKALPDLYAGEALMFAARTDTVAGDLKLTGTGQTAEWQASFNLKDGKPGEGIGKLWARSRIDALFDSLLDGADKDFIRDEVIRISLNHHLVSRYTSLIAVDVTPVRPDYEVLNAKAVSANLPYGQVPGKSIGIQAQTGTSQYLLFTLGCLFLLVTLCLQMFNKIRGETCTG